MLDQRQLWESLGWTVDDGDAQSEELRRRLDDAFGGEWLTDEGFSLYSVYSAATAERQAVLEQLAADAGARGDAAKFTIGLLLDFRRPTGRYAGAEDQEYSADQITGMFWDGSGWQAGEQGEHRWDEELGWVALAGAGVAGDDSATYADAVDLATDDAWRAYAGWWRRYDEEQQDYFYARSNRRDDTWVTQDQMLAQATYPDAVDASTDEGWEAYRGWWRRFDAEVQDYRYARSTLVNDTWITAAELPAVQATTPEPGQTEPARPEAVQSEPTQPEAVQSEPTQPEAVQSEAEQPKPTTDEDGATPEAEIADEILAELRQIEGIENLSQQQLLALVGEAMAD